MECIIENKKNELFKITKSIYNLYNILANSKNEQEYKQNKELLECALKFENRLVDSINSEQKLESILNYFDNRLNCTVIDNYLNIELPFYFNDDAKAYSRILYRLDKKFYNILSDDNFTYKEYLSQEVIIHDPSLGEIKISRDFVNNNDGITLWNNQKSVYIDFKEQNIKEDEDFLVVKEGVVHKGKLYFFKDDDNVEVYFNLIDKVNTEIILNFLNNSNIDDKEYICKLMYNNEYLEKLLLQFDLDIEAALEFFNYKKADNEFYNYLLKQYTSCESKIIDILCKSSSPNYEIYVPYLKTILGYKTEEELENINYMINDDLEVLNIYGFKQVQNIFKSLAKQKRKNDYRM